MSITIRSGKQKDVPDVLRELKNFARFYGSKFCLYKDDDTSSIFVNNLMDNHLFLVSADEDDNMVGFITGMLLPHMFNPDIITLVEVFWWVNSSHRRSKAGLKLLNAYVDYGKQNADWIICTLESHSPVNDKAFIKRGFKYKEKSFLMEVQ